MAPHLVHSSPAELGMHQNGGVWQGWLPTDTNVVACDTCSFCVHEHCDPEAQRAMGQLRMGGTKGPYNCPSCRRIREARHAIEVRHQRLPCCQGMMCLLAAGFEPLQSAAWLLLVSRLSRRPSMPQCSGAAGCADAEAGRVEDEVPAAAATCHIVQPVLHGHSEVGAPASYAASPATGAISGVCGPSGHSCHGDSASALADVLHTSVRAVKHLLTSSVWCRMYISSSQKAARPEEVSRLTENAWRNLSAHERAPYEKRVKCVPHLLGCRRLRGWRSWCCGGCMS